MNLLLLLSAKVSANVLPTPLSHTCLKHKCVGQCTVECWEWEGFSISSCSSQNTNHLAGMGSSSKLALVIQDVPNHTHTSPEFCLPPEHSPCLDQTFLPLVRVTFNVYDSSEKLHCGSLVTANPGKMSKPICFPIKPAWQSMAYRLV